MCKNGVKVRVRDRVRVRVRIRVSVSSLYRRATFFTQGPITDKGLTCVSLQTAG